LSTLDVQIKSIIEQLNNFKSILTRLCTTTGLGAFSEFEKTISGVIKATREVNILYNFCLIFLFGIDRYLAGNTENIICSLLRMALFIEQHPLDNRIAKDIL